jgi:hypothetical protein
MRVSHRPLVLVSGLTFGDFLLWHWSLNSKHDVLALVSGLSLPILGVALVWLLIVSAMRLLVRHSRPIEPQARATARVRAGSRGPADAEAPADTGRVAAAPVSGRRPAVAGREHAGSGREPQPAAAPTAPSRRPARKIAA